MPDSLTTSQLADQITDMQWRHEPERGRAVWEFGVANHRVVIRDPYPELLQDDRAGREWLARHYGFILEFLLTIEQVNTISEIHDAREGRG